MDVDCSANNGAFNLRPLLAKRANLFFSTLRTRSDAYKTELIKRFSSEILPDFETGKLKPIVDKVFNMSEIAKAHEYMEKNENIGKIIVKCDL
jgi:NADPH:quinone reductase-like Zn-dependent oxidoreductase